jgi:hypothetical protein
MTDQELRELGQKFIDSQKKIWSEAKRVERSLDPMLDIQLDARWDFIDPFRMGLFLAVKSAEGVFSIDFDHICKVCLNPVGFRQPKPTPSIERARSVDFNTLSPPPAPTRARISDFFGGLVPPAPAAPAPTKQRVLSEVPFESF